MENIEQNLNNIEAESNKEKEQENTNNSENNINLDTDKLVERNHPDYYQRFGKNASAPGEIKLNKVNHPKRKFAIIHGYNGHGFSGNQK